MESCGLYCTSKVKTVTLTKERETEEQEKRKEKKRGGVKGGKGGVE